MEVAGPLPSLPCLKFGTELHALIYEATNRTLSNTFI